jgi:hypothetical protein
VNRGAAFRGLFGALLVLLALAPIAAGAQTATSPDATRGAPQGNVTPTTTPAKGVAAVAQSALVDGRVAVLVQNATTKAVRIQRITAVASSADGSVATKATSVKAYPQVVAPGELALTSVRFRAKALAVDPNAQPKVKVRSTPVSSARAQRVLSVGGLALSAPQTGPVAQTMQATLTNSTRAWKAPRPEAAVMCFGEAGNPTTFAAAPASARRVAPGASVAATVPLTTLCPTYLVAARAS